MRGVWLILAAAVLEVAAHSPLCERTGIESCWARYQDLCIPRPLFRAWLRSGPDGPWSGLPDPDGRRFRPGPAGPKAVALRLPPQAPRWGGFWGLVRGVESRREALSVQLEGRDPGGLLARLLIGQADPDGGADLAAAAGLLFLAGQSGLHLLGLASLILALGRWIGAWGGIGPAIARRTAEVLAAGACAAFWILGGLKLGLLRAVSLGVLRAWAVGAGFKWAPAVLVAAGAAAHFLGLQAGPGPWALAGALAAAALPSRVSWTAPWILSAGAWLGASAWAGFSGGTCAPYGLLLAPLELAAACGLVIPAALAGQLPWAARVWDSLIPPLVQELWTAGGLWVSCGALWRFGAVVAAMRWSLGAKWGRRAGLAALAGALVWRAVHAPVPLSTVIQRDVGQGDSAWVLTEGRAGLVDVGSATRFRPLSWIREAASLGIGRVDWILLTHLDEDHAGALVRLAATVRVGCVEVDPIQLAAPRGRRLASSLARESIPVRSPGECAPRDSVAEFAPARGGVGRGNDRMTSVAVRAGPWVYINGGDMDARQEREWWPRLRARLASWGSGARRVLKASHHGSGGSTDGGFLRDLNPSLVWVSSGRGNPHGHPSAGVLLKAAALRVPLRRTDRQGSLQIPPN
ncbi:MAG TPA: MBL fold metallo-hydrolase [Bdellovibrionota bacterium]|nr:MBL fold metallo-hydrolase [Bdellovibrionota bacterium]